MSPNSQPLRRLRRPDHPRRWIGEGRRGREWRRAPPSSPHHRCAGAEARWKTCASNRIRI